MRELESRLPPKRHLSTEWHRALQLLASNLRGSTEHMLVLGQGFSSNMLPTFLGYQHRRALTFSLFARTY